MIEKKPTLDYDTRMPGHVKAPWAVAGAWLSCVMPAAALLIPFAIAEAAEKHHWLTVSAAERLSLGCFISLCPIGLVTAALSARALGRARRTRARRLAVVAIGLNAAMCALQLLALLTRP